MKKVAAVVVFAFASVFSGLVAASEITDASMNKLLELSGISKQVSEFPGLLQMGIEQAKQQEKAKNKKPVMSDAEYSELGNTMIGAFKPADILQTIAGEVTRTVSEEDAKKMLAWYESELGRNITKAEEAGSTPDAYREMVAAAKTLLADEERVQFAKKLDQLLQITDMTLRLQENTSLAMVVAFSTAANPDKSIDQKEFRAKLSAMLKQVKPNIEQSVILSSVYAYRNVDLASLEKYLGFLKTEPAMRFNTSLMSGLGAGMEQSMSKMAKSIAALAKRKHNPKA